MSRDDYIKYGSRRRKRDNGGPVAAIVFVVFIAVACGFTAFWLAKGNLGDKPSTDQLTNFLDPNSGANVTQVAEVPTETPTPTLTPSPTPTPRGEIMMYETAYLEGFEDTRERRDVRAIIATDISLTSDRLQHYLDICDNTEINAIVINVKNDDGTISYDMDCESVKEAGTIKNTVGDMKGLLELLHSHDIYCIARVDAFLDSALHDSHPEYFAKKTDGTTYVDGDKRKWINPYDELACRYIVDVACQCIIDGFDEVCFDYIRVSTYSGMKSVDFGRNAERFTLTEQIAEFCKYAANRVKPLGGFLSASVFGAIINSSVDAAIIGQDYVAMARYLDYICPMVYPSHYAAGYAGISVPDADPYALIDFEMKKSNKKLAEAEEETGEKYALCRPWLQAFTASWVKGYVEYTGDVCRQQVEACYDNGINIWMYWNSGGKYRDDYFAKEW